MGKKRSKRDLADSLRNGTKPLQGRNAGMNPPSGMGAPCSPHQMTPDEMKALGNPVAPVDARPRITHHGDLNQSNADPDSWRHGKLTSHSQPDGDLHGTGVRDTLGDAVISYADPRALSMRMNGLTNRPNGGVPRTGLFGHSARLSATDPNGSHVASQSNVSNAVAGKVSNIAAAKELLNEMSRKARG
jgi:hypothetical protein